MKRFYQLATVMPAGGQFTILLDGKPLRTPAKAPLVVPSQALAEAIAAEWQGQEMTVQVSRLPLTRLASTALDIIAARRADIVSEIAKYAGTDLVCYRADHPPALVRQQLEVWQPLVDWAMVRYDAPLVVTDGITPVPQPETALRALAAAVDAHDHLSLAGLLLATTASGSLVIALALMEDRLDPDEASAASQLDESFEIERWGEDPEQTQRRADLKEDITLARRFVTLLRAT